MTDAPWPEPPMSQERLIQEAALVILAATASRSPSMARNEAIAFAWNMAEDFAEMRPR